MRSNLIKRESYLEQITQFSDEPFIKILTGLRGSGKSSLLELVRNKLIEDGIKADQIIFINFKSPQFNNIDYKSLYYYLKNQYKGERLYLFLDEIQFVKDWAKTIISIWEEIDCDIYIASSNFSLFRDKSITYLSGRYVTFNILALNFNEYLNFLGFTTYFDESDKDPIYRSINGDEFSTNQIVNRFIQYGSLTETSKLELNKKELEELFQKNLELDLKQIFPEIDLKLINQIIQILVKEIGNSISLEKILTQLIKDGVQVNLKVLEEHLEALSNTYLFYSGSYFHLRGSSDFFTSSPFYISDLGILNSVLKNGEINSKVLIKNLIFMELLKRNYAVFQNSIESDFIAISSGRRFKIKLKENGESSNKNNRIIKNKNDIEIVISEETTEYGSQNKTTVPLLTFLKNKELLS